jgi:hypothetical protein
MKGAYACLLAGCLASAAEGGEQRGTTFAAAIGITNLTKKQAIKFEKLACLPHDTGLDAAEGTGYATRNDYKLTRVYVRCKPHRHIDGQPVAYVVYCTRAVQGKWDCSHAEETLFARINGTTFSISVNNNALQVDEAYRVFRYLASQGELRNALPNKPFNHLEGREVTFAVWKNEGDRVFVRCDRYLVLTRLGPGSYQLEPLLP